MEKRLLNEKFMDEYGSERAVHTYTAKTAGYGISYLLRNDYARIYLKVVNALLHSNNVAPLRLLEFGCGGGMNIIRLLSLLAEEKIPIECAMGRIFLLDFSKLHGKRQEPIFLPALPKS